MTILGNINSATNLASGNISDFAEAVDDRVSTLLVAGANVTLTYNDAAGTLTIASVGGGGGSFIDTISDTNTIDLSVTGTTLSAVIPTTATPQVAQLGLGQAANSTRLSFPAATTATGGIDLGGDVSVYRQAAGKLRVERPSGGLSHFEINAASGQDALLSLSENGIAQWRLRYTASDGTLAIRDDPGARNLLLLQPDGRIEAGSEPDTLTPGNSIRAMLASRQGGTRDGRSNQGTPASDGLTRNNDRISFTYTSGAGEFANTTNGTRGDDVTAAGALSGGHSGFHDTIGAHVWDAKGALVPHQVSITLISKPTGAAYPNTYAECVPFVSRIEDVRSKGTYAGSWESFLKISNGADHADAGPIQGFGSLVQLQERNAYTTYDDSAIFALSPGWRTTGARGLWIHSAGSAVVGTGIHLRGSGGYKRVLTYADTAGVEQFCIDVNGNIGVRRVTDQTTTLTIALTVGYTSAGAASTVAADGIGFGGDVELFRSAANVLRTPDTLSVGGFLNLNDPASGYLQETELTSAPGAPPANVGRVYFRNDKIVISFNNGTTTQYLTCDLSNASPSSTWAVSTTAP
jgi:hypothetical protein